MDEINTIEEFERDYRLGALVSKKINIPITIPYNTKELYDSGFTNIGIEFEKCIFNEPVKIKNHKNKDAQGRVRELSIKFTECKFMNTLDAHDSYLEAKVRFRQCDFIQAVNFKNTTFTKLADFWQSTFHKPTTFYKTNFKDIVVFSAVNFKENVLFTYTLIEKLMILRGTYPEKGFDLSLAIISGELSIFDFNFDNYNTHINLYKKVNKHLKEVKNVISYTEAYEIVYERAVSENGQIPLENKRETHRILKNQLISQKNFIDAVPFRVKENKTLLRESWQKLINGHTFTGPLSNIFVLSLNAISNWFGSSYILGAFFTLSIATLFFNLSIYCTEHTAEAFNLSSVGDGIKNYLNFLNPTHKFNYLGNHVIFGAYTKSGFYVYDFLGRIFVGYGIFQTIQAFRKYK